MSGWLPIPAGEFQAWAVLTGALIRPAEWTILFEMDRMFVTTANAKIAAGEQAQIGSDQEMTPAMFDAVMG